MTGALTDRAAITSDNSPYRTQNRHEARLQFRPTGAIDASSRTLLESKVLFFRWWRLSPFPVGLGRLWFPGDAGWSSSFSGAIGAKRFPRRCVGRFTIR